MKSRLLVLRQFPTSAARGEGGAVTSGAASRGSFRAAVVSGAAWLRCRVVTRREVDGRAAGHRDRNAGSWQPNRSSAAARLGSGAWRKRSSLSGDPRWNLRRSRGRSASAQPMGGLIGGQ